MAAQQQYREHNLRLARSLGRSHRSFEASEFEKAQRSEKSGRNARASSLARGEQHPAQLDDLYKDFDSIYKSLCEHRPKIDSTEKQGQGLGAEWSAAAAFETVALAESLADVEEALRRAASLQVCQDNEPLALGSSGHQLVLAGRPASEAASERTAAGAPDGLQRADSRNTNQSSLLNGGPALVEEMTLSDLEEEICSTLMAAKDDERQRRYAEQERAMLSNELLEHLACGRRSRAPLPAQLFGGKRLQVASHFGAQFYDIS